MPRTNQSQSMTDRRQSGEPRKSGKSDSNVNNMKQPKEDRQLVLPGDAVGDKRTIPGPGTKKVGDRVVATSAGLLQQMGEKVSVLPLNGAYDPRPGDQVIGIVTEANTGNWIIDIKAPWLCPLHVSEVPWRVDFGETTSYLRTGDAILCKVLFVDEQKKVQVTLKDRNLMKLEGGELMDVGAVKVARVIGKNGSMLNLIKGYVECWLHVGQNGRIWLNGEPKEVLMAKKVIQTIADEAHLPGLTERVTALLEQMRPGGLDAGIVTERNTRRNEPSSKADAAADNGDKEN